MYALECSRQKIIDKTKDRTKHNYFFFGAVYKNETFCKIY